MWMKLRQSDLDPAEEEIRRILIRLAKRRELITYSSLVRLVRSSRMNPNSVSLSNRLTSISEKEFAAGRRLLSAVVVR